MQLLLLTQHFPPEITAASFRLGPIAEAVAAAGDRVDVVCPVPNHPSGVVDPRFRGRPLVRQRRGALRVRYLPLHARPVKTLRTRLLAYGSYALGAAIAGAVHERPDLVLASSPPLSVGFVGAMLAARHRCPFVFDVRDLWPDSAVDLGELEPGPAVRAAERLERWLYGRADLILTPNQAFAETIEGRGAGGPVELVPNGTTRQWLVAGEREVDRAELGLPDDRFVWAYAGNLGLAHALDEAIEAARLLGEGFRLLIIGAGPRRAELERQAASLPRGTVDFRGLMGQADAARHLRAADAVLVAERQASTVSAKLYDCCAVGRPLIAVCTGELERVVSTNQIGFPVSLDDPEALAAALRRLRAEPRLGRDVVARARAFAAENLRDRQAGRVAELLAGLHSGHVPVG